MGASYRVCSGRTQPGNTMWKEYDPARPHFGILVEVDISDGGFTAPPVVVTSLHGDNILWEVTGTSSVYNLSPKGFSVYLKLPSWDRGKEVGLSPGMANSNKWHIHWIASGT
jgi:hypothetical protein